MDTLRRTFLARLIPAVALALIAGAVSTAPAMAAASSATVSDVHTTVSDVQLEARAAEGCAGGYLCLYSENDYQGEMLALYDCGFVDLGQIDFPGGGKWNDRMSSYINNQTGGTTSAFYNWGGSWVWYFDSTAYDARSELDSIGSNNIIDGVSVC